MYHRLLTVVKAVVEGLTGLIEFGRFCLYWPLWIGLAVVKGFEKCDRVCTSLEGLAGFWQVFLIDPDFTQLAAAKK